jgi:type I restriction enzyme S subunit
VAVWSSIFLSGLGGAFRLDAEFWRPEYLAVERGIRGQPHDSLGSLAVAIRKGVFNILADSYVESGVPFYRSSNVGVIVPKTSGTVFITAERHAEEANTALGRGDLILAKTGKEAASVILEPECNVSQDVVAVRLDRERINPFFAAVFLNTRPGILQMRRWFQGQVQMHLSLPDTRKILIPLPPPAFQSGIQEMVEASETETANANKAILAAENALVAAIGLDHLDLSPTLSYEQKLSDLFAAKRFGAEYYMPVKRRVIDALSSGAHKTFSDHCDPVREVFEPNSARPGETVRNFDLGDARSSFLDDSQDPAPAAEIGSTKKRFRAGDVVISRLRSYLKEIAVVRCSDTVPCVGSSEFVVLRPRAGGLSAESLLIYLRSPLIQTILQWSQDGSNHPRFNQNDLLGLPVPERLVAVQGEIDAMVHKAIAGHQAAAAWLAKAKAAVEKLVDEARESAA